MIIACSNDQIASVAAAREIAARSMVLLKNDHETLPLNRDVKSIALIGPLADAQQDMIGPWNGDGNAADAANARLMSRTIHFDHDIVVRAISERLSRLRSSHALT